MGSKPPERYIYISALKGASGGTCIIDVIYTYIPGVHCALYVQCMLSVCVCVCVFMCALQCNAWREWLYM